MDEGIAPQGQQQGRGTSEYHGGFGPMLKNTLNLFEFYEPRSNNARLFDKFGSRMKKNRAL